MTVTLTVVLILLVCMCGAAYAVRTRRVRRSTPSRSAPDLNDLSVRLVAMEVQRLHGMPITSAADREVWYVEARAVERKLSGDYASVFAQLPHELMHYLSDADIRANDAEYARYQENEIKGLLTLNTHAVRSDA